MSVVPVNQPNRTSRLQGRWDRRDVAELSQTNFRTTMRGFDREEVRAVLDSVAADYRVLQLQNASLQRQLTHLEAVLQDYQRDHDDTAGLAVKQALERTKDDARAALVRANAQAEEMMGRITAFAREAECRVSQLEEDRRNFRTMLVSTISEMITILSRYEYRMDPLVLELPAPLPRAIEPPPITRAISGITNNAAATLQPAPAAEPAPAAPIPVAPEPVHHEDEPVEMAPPVEKVASSLALVPMPIVDRDTARRTDDTRRARSSAFEFQRERADASEPMRAILKNLDKALVEIPALTCE